jgi:hypothetical protein
MSNLRRSILPMLLAVAISAFGGPAAQPHSPGASETPALNEALHWLQERPRFDAEYDFEMTVGIRLLFFWTGKDDVGGGYIKMGRAAADPSLEVIQLLFGSDPSNAHGINRWGAGTEVARRGPGGAVDSSAFFGFMKSSQGESVGAMRQELVDEKQQGQHRFEAIISRVDPGHAVSTMVPFYSHRDFDFREFATAEKVVLGQVEEGQARKFDALTGASAGCSRSGGFLSTVQQLAGDALDEQPVPVSLCYVYNSHPYTLTLDAVQAVPEKTVHFTLSDSREKVDRQYHNLKEARFHTVNQATGKKTSFALLLGTTGDLRGAPIQISYQPNWCFRITLNLKPPAGEAANRH